MVHRDKTKSKTVINDATSRVWLRLRNFHENLRARGYDNCTMPAVPDSHIPLGCVFMTFRSLREPIWSPGVYEYDRPLRLSQQ